MLSSGAFSGMTGDIPPAMMTFYSVFAVIVMMAIQVLIFELLARLSYNLLQRRFTVACDKNNYIVRLRMAYFYANIVLGIVGIIYFFVESTRMIVPAVLDFAVPTLFIAVFYDDLRCKCVPKRNNFRVYDYMGKLYLLIHITVSAFMVMQYLLEGGLKDGTTLQTVSEFVDLGVKGLFFIPFFFCFAKLKIKSEGDEDNPLFIRSEGDELRARKPFDDLDI
jgi:hypothetical protein